MFVMSPCPSTRTVDGVALVYKWLYQYYYFHTEKGVRDPAIKHLYPDVTVFTLVTASIVLFQEEITPLSKIVVLP